MKPTLTLGPVLFNWPAERWRDFYARIADEAPVDAVVVGEIVCSKRAPFLAPVMDEVIARLAAAGKEVWLASPILVGSDRERAAMRDLVESDLLPVEANDMGALALLEGRRHAVGPFINSYNEATLMWLAGRGAVAVSLPAELPAASVAVMAKTGTALGLSMEVQVFGRAPLAISARCYHARAHALHKDGCQFVCANDPDGMPVSTVDGQPFLSVNGTQTLSHGYLALAAEIDRLRAMGIRRFRLSPQDLDMVAVATAFRAVLDGARSGQDVMAELRGMTAVPLENGFFHNMAGAAYADAPAA
ncbi:U32 family peptidase (plasmid) [Azospirillum brasilense]|uniref:Ubiquinone biosynthesis protein UbiV n=1 Tax=Azospirillum brasilense TaxID=192 RepID=A0A4D8QPY8_AZOBR|nr:MULTISPECIES: U32 family peptidase [Azospirillum]MDW7555474.1 U32 family peptidase [Azospirillum brasilense]MDW7595118.1 U32 family peptidase [Azospirillum brasilense]MDW7630271.1 U32 family peptidase [Azospirillum brasilense]MDX5949639.1 U32 family peptidase [Azospirillum brasilense]OPH12210.1 protease [Azospirillum brasilense]